MIETTFMTPKPKTKDFWLLYPQTNQTDTLSDTLHALYYLPKNYKLLIMNDGQTAQSIMDVSAHMDLKGRIEVQKEAGISTEKSPFSFAHALISDDATPEIVKQTIRSQVIVSTKAKKAQLTRKPNGFAVPSGNPLALASAVLKLGRSQA